MIPIRKHGDEFVHLVGHDDASDIQMKEDPLCMFCEGAFLHSERLHVQSRTRTAWAQMLEATKPEMEIVKPDTSTHEGANEEALTFPVNLPQLLIETEAKYVAAALKKSNGVKKNAAQLIGMSRTGLSEILSERGRHRTLDVLARSE